VHGGQRSGPNFEARADQAGVLDGRTLLVSYEANGGGPWVPAGQPGLPVEPAPRLRVGDLFARVQTGAVGRVTGVREINTAENSGGASAVPEGGEKPAATLEFEREDLGIGKFAVTIPATEELLEDVPGLVDYIDRRLMDSLRVREADELLNGDGTGENLLGLRNADIATQAFATSVAESVARGLARIEDADGIADAVVIDPVAYEVSVAANAGYWSHLASRLRIVPSPAAGADKAVVGAFSTGAVVRERSTVVKFSDSHELQFVSNIRQLLAERREALFTNVPAWFADVSLA